MNSFDGLGMNLGNLSRLSLAKTRSISPENFTGEKGRAGMATEGTGQKCARDLGIGWKVSPSVRIKAGEVFTVADINGPGAVQHSTGTIRSTPRLRFLSAIFSAVVGAPTTDTTIKAQTSVNSPPCRSA